MTPLLSDVARSVELSLGKRASEKWALRHLRYERRASRQHLATALAMFHELGMASWSERAERRREEVDDGGRTSATAA